MDALCPRCRTELQAGSTVCPRCGVDAADALLPAATPMPKGGIPIWAKLVLVGTILILGAFVLVALLLPAWISMRRQGSEVDAAARLREIARAEEQLRANGRDYWTADVAGLHFAEHLISKDLALADLAPAPGLYDPPEERRRPLDDVWYLALSNPGDGFAFAGLRARTVWITNESGAILRKIFESDVVADRKLSGVFDGAWPTDPAGWLQP